MWRTPAGSFLRSRGSAPSGMFGSVGIVDPFLARVADHHALAGGSPAGGAFAGRLDAGAGRVVIGPDGEPPDPQNDGESPDRAGAAERPDRAAAFFRIIPGIFIV